MKDVGVEIRLDDLCGLTTCEAIKFLKPGEELMLNNLRLALEEVMEATLDKQASIYLVQRLAAL